MEPVFFLVGGDRRQTVLCKLLRERYRVRTLSVPETPDCLPSEPVHIILPCPAFSPDGTIRGGPAKEALAPYLLPNTVVFCGMPASQRPWLEQRGVRVIDLLQDETTAVENAQLTAQAAVCVALQHTQQSLLSRRCAVLGCGRIGSVLAQLLAAHGAQVTVFARRPAVRASVLAKGLAAQGFDEPLVSVPELVFNTVPMQALPDETLAALPSDCVWVELASAPGGLSQQVLAFERLPAPSLPGRVLPVSAAQVLLRAILRNAEVTL